MTEHQQMKKWKETAQKELKGRPLESLTWETPEGISVKPVYTRETTSPDFEVQVMLNCIGSITIL